MPSESPKQKRFMRIAAHDPEFAKQAGISQKIAQEFYAADQQRDRIAHELLKQRGRPKL